MRRTATTISTIFLLLSSILFAVNQEKVPERYKLQGAFEGRHIENLEAAEAELLKGPDMTPDAVKREDLPGVKAWSADDYIKASPKNRHGALTNTGSPQKSKSLSGKTIITKGKEQVDQRTAPISSWSREQYLSNTPTEKQDAILNMQKAPSITKGEEADAEIRTKSITDFSQEELQNITPESRHAAIEGSTMSFRVGRAADITIDISADYFSSESSWNLYDSSSGAYYYSSNQTFSSSYENQVVTLELEAGMYSVDVWDSYGDGGVSGSVADANGVVLTSWSGWSYDSFGQFGFLVPPPTFTVTISLDADYFYSESSWNVYDSSSGAYYYSSNQTFSTYYENQTVSLELEAGLYSVDIWDSYGDGGVSGTVSDWEGNTIATVSASYGSFGSFAFGVGLYDVTVSLDADYFSSESSWNLYDSSAAAYYYSANQTFSSSYENQTTVFSLAEGMYSVDIWDSYGDGGVSGTVSDADGNTLVQISGSSYTSFGQYGFEVAAPVVLTSDLFFSEYVEGSSNNKALEVYNPTGDTLSLDNYIIYTNYNGNSWSSGDDGRYTFPSGATVLPGEVYVIASSAAGDEVLQAADSTYDYGTSAYITAFNGDDARGLAKIHGTDTTIIDLIGFYDIEADSSSDPGSGWDVAGVSAATANHTLVRKVDVTMGNTDWATSAGTDSADSEWMVYDQNHFANLGGHPDDPCWENAINLTMSSVSYGSEVSYMLMNSDGDTLVYVANGTMSNNQTNSHDFCLGTGTYSFWGMDTYGDGWNGGSFSITAEDGSVLASGAVSSAASGYEWVEFPFAIDLPVFSAEDVDFNGLVLGDSETRTLTITNAGYGDSAVMNISSATSDNVAFAVSATLPATLSAGESMSMSVTYTASADSTEEAEISIVHDGDTSMVYATGYGVDAVFWEDFDPWTGDATVLPMDGWTILDNNGDADSIPQLYKTWYHDDYGVGSSGNMVAYVGFSNGYDADETIITPMIHLDAPSKLSFQAYDYNEGLEISYTELSTVDSAEQLTHLANKVINGFWSNPYEVILPDVDSLRIGITFSGTSFTYMNIDEVSVVALPNTYVSGSAVDAETGEGIDSVVVDINGNTVYTNTSGEYELYGFSTGDFNIYFSHEDYNGANFYVEVDEGDSLELWAHLVPEDSLEYSTGFEPGDDLGSTMVESGSGDFAVVDSFMTVWTLDDEDTITYGDTSWHVADYYGDSLFMVYPDSGAGYENLAYAYWKAGETFSVSDYVDESYLNMRVTAKYAVEVDYDYFYAGLMLDDSSIYWAENGIFTGVDEWWSTYYIDVAWVAAMASDSATPVIVFESDSTYVEGWGGAFDNIELEGNPHYLAEPQNLAAASYGADIPLTWSEPAAVGAVDYEVRRVDPRNIQSVGWETTQDNRSRRDYEKLSVRVNFDNSGSQRELISYNVWRTEWPFGDMGLLDSTGIDSYTDTDVEDGGYYQYFVTAVYDEGTSIASSEVHARAGMPAVVMAGVTDFEDMTLGGWESITETPGAAFVVGDSALADSLGAFTNTTLAYTPSPHGNFVFTGSGLMESNDQAWLLSPNYDLTENTSAELRFEMFNPGYNGSVHVRADMGEWEYLMNVYSYATNDWVELSVPLSDYAGHDYVQLGFNLYYGTYSYGNGLALDDISFDVISGPQNLVAEATINDVTLTWDSPGAVARPNEYPNGVDMLEKNFALMQGQDNDPGTGAGFSRVQGDSISNPFVIDSVPYFDDADMHQIFWDSASTVGFTNDYDEVCPYSGSTSPDVVYEITLDSSAVKMVVDLCESYYDSKVYIYANGDVNDLVACNDDYCSASHGQSYTSYLELSDVEAGTYHIVIDGYGGDEGTYLLDVSVQYNYPGLTYNVYKNGNLELDELDTNAWVDNNASLNESDYAVSGTVFARYLAGGNPPVSSEMLIETEQSNTVSIAMENQPPGEFTLLSPSDGDTLVITADDLGSSQLFAWGASVDPNGTPVEYEICINIQTPFDQFCEDNGTSTAHFVTLEDIVSYLDSVGVPSVDLTWTVYANDGMDETEASNGPRSYHIDAGWVLGIYDELIPVEFALHQNYPNPFNPVTNIRFDIPEEGNVRMDIYNITGQKVATLVNGRMQPGFHSIRWDGTNDLGKQLASGMYIYHIKAGDFRDVKKLLLVK